MHETDQWKWRETIETEFLNQINSKTTRSMRAVLKQALFIFAISHFTHNEHLANNRRYDKIDPEKESCSNLNQICYKYFGYDAFIQLKLKKNLP